MKVFYHGKFLCCLIQMTSNFVLVSEKKEKECLRPLLHSPFLDQDIIFILLDNIGKNQESFSQVLNSFENIMKNGAFCPKEQMLHFP